MPIHKYPWKPLDTGLLNLEETFGRKDYIQNLISQITSSGIPKLVSHPIDYQSPKDNNTQFEIPTDIYEIDLDTLVVYRENGSMLAPNKDYLVTQEVIGEGENKIVRRGIMTLIENTHNPALSINEFMHILILKNTPIGDEGSVNGRSLAVESIPQNRLILTGWISDLINSHKLDNNNPHNVTKASIGLSNVENLSVEEIRTGTTKTHVGLSAVSNVLQASKEEFDVHALNKTNPHSVTKAQIGLGNVTNDKQLAEATFNTYKEALEPRIISLGSSSTTAHRGDHGLAAYNHSLLSHAPSNAQKNSDITKAEIEAKLIGNISSHAHSSIGATSTTIIEVTDKIQFIDANQYIKMLATATGGKDARAGASDQNIYFNVGGGTNRGFVFKNGTTVLTHIDSVGNLFATKVWSACYNDLAEFMYTNKDKINYEPGDVMISTKEGLDITTKENDRRVIGVYSDTFGYSLGSDDMDNKVPIGISGRVLVKVIGENFEPGDLLVSSSICGHAMVNNDAKLGTVVGKVFDGELIGNKIWMSIMNS